MAAARRKGTGRTKAEIAETKSAYRQLMKIIEKEGGGVNGGEANPLLMGWLDEIRMKAESVMLADHLNR